ncbi:MAG: hypothetical protein H0U53_06975 [Actinobacteria bacterium]|nr:hypothetical protein [Actinomycetota bacterium]
MLVYYFVYVPLPVAETVRSLTDKPGDLTVWARLAYEGGEELRMRVQPEASRLTKEVEVVVGKPRAQSKAVYVPISWRATGAESLFPWLDADLIVEAVGDTMTQVTLRGSYEPPLGPVGRLLDRALLHHLAESCVKNFMDRLQAALDPASPTPVAN